MLSISEKRRQQDGLVKSNLDSQGIIPRYHNTFMEEKSTGLLKPAAAYKYESVPLYSPGATVQQNLSVFSSNSKYENEADAFAGNRQQGRDKITPVTQSASEVTADMMPSVKKKIQSSLGSGVNMSEQLNADISGNFGADFSQVKIHNDAEAVNLTRELNANAFTVGSDIYFNSGKYAPQTMPGKQLLAHELTHTLQQNAGDACVQKDEGDPTFAKKPDIDFTLLPPDFKLRFHHLIFEADTGKVQLDYQTRSLKAGLSYKYGDALTLGLKKDGLAGSVGWTPGENKLSLGLSKGDFSGKFSATPAQGRIGLGLHYGDKLLPTPDAMGKTFTAGGMAAGNMLGTLPGALDDPMRYYQDHKSDVTDISKSVDLVKQVTDSGKKRVRFGADFGLTWDPVSQLAVTVRVGANF
jgi:hypothetical protein